MVTLGGIFYENPLDGCYVSFEEVTLDMTNKTSKVPQGAEIVSFSGKKMVVRVPVTVGRVFVTFPTAVGRSPGNLLGLVRSTDKADLKRLALAELAPDNEV